MILFKGYAIGIQELIRLCDVRRIREFKLSNFRQPIISIPLARVPEHSFSCMARVSFRYHGECHLCFSGWLVYILFHSVFLAFNAIVKAFAGKTAGHKIKVNCSHSDENESK